METEKINAVETPVAVEAYRHNHNHKPLLIGGIVIAFVLVLALGLFAGHVAMRHNLAQRVGSRIELNQGMMNNQGGFGPMNGQRPMGGQRHFGSGQAANRQFLTGVVTVVNGANFTVAGNGSTETVNTSGSTTFVGKTSVSVNDTVRVIGTVSGSVWTADRVIVNQ
jgi:hypothetical protein